MTDTERVVPNDATAYVSPIGSTAAAAHRRRATNNPEYLREWNAQAAAREIAWQLVKYRMDNGLTQEELAETLIAGQRILVPVKPN